MTFELAEGAVLLGIQDESVYPLVPYRAGGIEIKAYPAGLLNGRGCEKMSIPSPSSVSYPPDTNWTPPSIPKTRRYYLNSTQTLSAPWKTLLSAM